MPMPFPALARPGHIGSLPIKNRIIHAPLVRNYADERGAITPRYIDHINRIARGGVGAIIVEASFVHPGGKGFARQVGIHDDEMISGLRALVDTAHTHGAAIGIQLFHGGRQASQQISASRPVAPSAIPDPVVNEVPRELTVAEIQELVDAFGAAARRAQTAGFDFVELHGAHGYLINQFLSPFSNHRSDAYGGSRRKRWRFVDEVYAAARSAVGPDYPITIRLSADEFVPGGLRLADTLATARHLEQTGIAAIHVSAGNYASFAQGVLISPMAVDDAPLVHLAAAVKRAVRIPVIAVDKIRTPALAERVLNDGAADFIALGRPLLADPDWPSKALSGREDNINPCIACNQGCIQRLFGQLDVGCTVNPESGHEHEFALPLSARQRVLVVGGGPAGMEAANVAAERGHEVELFEQASTLGGQLHAAAAAPHRRDWLLLQQSQARRLQANKVTLHTATPVTVDDVAPGRYDVAIIATGSREWSPALPGKPGTMIVTTARAVLEGRCSVHGRVIIAGGGCSGAQAAEFLAKAGHTVTLIEATPAIASEAPIDDRALLLSRLASLKVTMLTDTKLMALSPGRVRVSIGTKTRTIVADALVLCLGATPNDELAPRLTSRVPRVLVVGDARTPRRVTDATLEGARAALMV
jgi:2,4-dienoyl-CoA reductase-like NADH-dependent reductase (Old Yellow Enzyme family)/thioredoxin reductase